MHSVEQCLADQLAISGYAKFGKASIAFKERGRVVMLRGRVSSYHLKQPALEIARLRLGARRVINCVDVQPGRQEHDPHRPNESDDESGPMRSLER